MRKVETEDAIGVTRKHRWMTVDIQEDRLRADGCRVVVSLDKIDRDQLVRMVREHTVIKAVYAFFLIDPRKRGVLRMTNDYSKFAEKLANLPRKCRAYIKDVDSGFLAETIPQRRVMLNVVEKQCAKHHKGAKSIQNLPRGGQVKVFSAEQRDVARQIWENVRRYPTWEAADTGFRERVPGFTVWRANREFGKR